MQSSLIVKVFHSVCKIEGFVTKTRQVQKRTFHANTALLFSVTKSMLWLNLFEQTSYRFEDISIWNSSCSSKSTQVHCCSDKHRTSPWAIGFLLLYKMLIELHAICLGCLNEVMSMILCYINNIPLEKWRPKLILIIDWCPGENKNKVKVEFLYSLVHILKVYKRITHFYFFFLVTGRSYLPNDQDFSLIFHKMWKATTVKIPEMSTGKL